MIQSEEHKQEEVEEEIVMGSFTTLVGNTMVRVSGQNLSWYQEMQQQLLDWTFVNITSMIVILLSASCVALVLQRETELYQYELLLGGGVLAYYCRYARFKMELNTLTQEYTEEDLLDEQEEEEWAETTMYVVDRCLARGAKYERVWACSWASWWASTASWR